MLAFVILMQLLQFVTPLLHAKATFAFRRALSFKAGRK